MLSLPIVLGVIQQGSSDDAMFEVIASVQLFLNCLCSIYDSNNTVERHS